VTANLYTGSSFKQQDSRDGEGIYGGGGIRLTGNYGDEKQSHLVALSQNLYNGQRYNTAQKNTRLFYNGGYHFDANNSLKALAGYSYNKFGANGFYAAPGDVNAEEIAETSIFSLSSKHKFGRFTLMPRISNRYDEDDYRYFKNDLSKGRSIHYTNALMLELNGSLSTVIGSFGLGWETRVTSINSTNIGKHDRNNHGAYVEYKRDFWGRLITNFGVYMNYNTAFGWQAYPGLDLAYYVNKKWKVSASLGSGQRIPSFTDLYLNQLPGNVGNPELQSENAWEYEASVDYSSGNFVWHAGTFYRKVSEFIDWVRADNKHPYTPYNFGNNEIYGLYTRVSNRFTFGEGHELGFRLSYNYLEPQLTENSNLQSKYVLETLKHQLIAGVNYSYKNFSIKLKNRFI